MRRVFVYEYLSAGGAAAAAEALLPQGVAMRDAIIADLLRVTGVATTCAVCDGLGAGTPRGAWAKAVQPGESAVAFVERMARLHDLAWVVAPESDGLLAQLHEAVGAARWIGCDAATIRVAASKRATLAALALSGVVTPLAFTDGHRGPWIVKPDDGAGAVDTVVHRDREAAQADLRQREDAGLRATLEPFIEGEALSVSMLAGRHSAEAIACNRQDIRIGPHGRLAYRGVHHRPHDPRAPRLRAVAEEVARAMPGLRGFVGIDVVWHPARGPVVIEVNPRVTCAYVGLSAALRRNLAADVLALHDLEVARHAYT